MTPVEATIREMQDQVNAALLASKWEVLNDLIADDARIIGPRGFLISREEWIGVHQESAYEQIRLETLETEVHAYDASGIRLDLVESECRYHGETINGRFRVCQSWATVDGDWRLAAVQYTAVA